MKPVSPLTNKALPHTYLVTNHALRKDMMGFGSSLRSRPQCLVRNVHVPQLGIAAVRMRVVKTPTETADNED
jgi:hypothetical protein